MAEIAGVIVGGIGICGQLFQLGSKIQRAVKTIKNSRRDIGKLAKETIIFAGLYQMFSSVCEESDPSVRNSVAIAELNSWAQTSADGLEELLQKVEALVSGDRSSHSIEENLIAHVQWFFSKSTVKALRASLSVARESINGFSTLLHVNKLDTNITLLKRALKNQESRRILEKKYDAPLEETILRFKQERKYLKMAHKENNNTLKEAVDKFVVYQKKRNIADNVPTHEQLLQFTAALDEYSEKTLPPRRSSNRTSISSSVPMAYIGRRTVPSVTRGAPVASCTPSIRSDSETYRERVFATRYSYSSSNISKTSSPSSTETSSSTSGAPPSASIATPGPSQNSVNTTQRADTTIERPGMGPREYVNDPNGTTLSPPIVKTPKDKHPTKTARVGRHTITLSAKVFHINAHRLDVTSYAAAYAFFQELLDHEDILNDLDEQLSNGCQKSIFYRTPCWQIEIGGIRMHGHSLS